MTHSEDQPVWVRVYVGRYACDGRELTDDDVGTLLTPVAPNPETPQLPQGWTREVADLATLRLLLKQLGPARIEAVEDRHGIGAPELHISPL